MSPFLLFLPPPPSLFFFLSLIPRHPPTHSHTPPTNSNWNGGSSVGLGSSIAAIEPSDIPDTIPLAFGRYFSRLDRAAGRLIPIDENPRPQAVLAR